MRRLCPERTRLQQRLLEASPGGAETKDSRGYTLPHYVSVVPVVYGADVQLEGHTLEQDWELTLDKDGNVRSWSLESKPPAQTTPERHE